MLVSDPSASYRNGVNKKVLILVLVDVGLGLELVQKSQQTFSMS